MIGKTYGVALALGAALATGCSSGGDPSSPAEKQPSRAATSPSAELPHGMRWVEHELGLRFGVPKSWTVIHGETVDDAANARAMKDFALSTAGDLSNLRANLRLDDYLVVGERASIYVGNSLRDSMPTEEDLRAEIDRLGGYARIDTVYTDLGPTTTMMFGVAEPRAVVSYMFVEVEEKVAVVAVTGRTHDQTSFAASQVVRTLSGVA